MRGLAGLLNGNRKPVEFVPLARMVNQRNHRGPDDLGIWTERYVGLAHTRLSIIDHASGQQPCITETNLRANHHLDERAIKSRDPRKPPQEE